MTLYEPKQVWYNWFMSERTYNLQEFDKKFGTEEQCLKYLYKMRWGDGFKCPRCSHNEKWDIDKFKYKCKKCGYQTTVTSGTLFHHTHIPIKRWFRAIWYMSSKSIRSWKGLQKELNIRKRMAVKMFNKLTWAMVKPKREKLRGLIFLNTYRIFTATDGYIYITNVANIKPQCHPCNINNFKCLKPFLEKYVEPGSFIYYRGKLTSSEIKQLNEYQIMLRPMDPYFFHKEQERLQEFVERNHLSTKRDIRDFLYCLNFFYYGLNNDFTFDEILKNAIESEPVSFNGTPFEFWQQYKEIPKIKYYRKKHKKRTI